MIALKPWKGYCCRQECYFATWVIREGSWVGSVALEDTEIGGKDSDIGVRREKKDAGACSRMMVVGRLLQWHYVLRPRLSLTV